MINLLNVVVILKMLKQKSHMSYVLGIGKSNVVSGDFVLFS